MKFNRFSNDSEPISSESETSPASVNPFAISTDPTNRSVSNKRPTCCPNSKLCRYMEGTVSCRRSVVLPIFAAVVLPVLTLVGVLASALSTHRFPYSFHVPITTPGLRLSADQRTATLSGINTCGRRSWHTAVTPAYVIHLDRRKNCIFQEEGAEVQIPPHSVLQLESNGSLTQKKSSDLKIAYSEPPKERNGQRGKDPSTYPEIETSVYSHVSLEQNSSLTIFVPPNEAPETLTWELGILLDVAVSGIGKISLFQGEIWWRRSFAIGENLLGLGAVSFAEGMKFEVENGTMNITKLWSRIPEEYYGLYIDSGTLISNTHYGHLDIHGTLNIKKGGYLKIEGRGCEVHKSAGPAHVTIEEGQNVAVTPTTPYISESGSIICDDW